jgi:cytochrome c5
VKRARSAVRRACAAALVSVCSVSFTPQALGADTPATLFPDGAASFQANCAVCHGAAGTGLPSLAPPLTAYPARYAATPEGRRQLAMTVLYGLFGEITVEDKHFDFKMTRYSPPRSTSSCSISIMPRRASSRSPPATLPRSAHSR